MPRQSSNSAQTAATVGLSLLAASEVPNFMAGLLPSLMTIKRFGAEDVDRATLRRGEVLGSLLALGLAVGASLVAQSPMPLFAAGIVWAVLLYAYEEAIRNPHPDATPIDQQGGVR